MVRLICSSSVAWLVGALLGVLRSVVFVEWLWCCSVGWLSIIGSFPGWRPWPPAGLGNLGARPAGRAALGGIGWLVRLVSWMSSLVLVGLVVWFYGWSGGLFSWFAGSMRLFGVMVVSMIGLFAGWLFLVRGW